MSDWQPPSDAELRQLFADKIAAPGYREWLGERFLDKSFGAALQAKFDELISDVTKDFIERMKADWWRP